MTDKLPRLRLDEMEPALAAYLEPRVARLQYLGEMFQCAASAPDVLLSFMHFTDALKAALPDALAEVAVLTVATIMDNRYERNQHERLCIRLGLAREWVAEVERLDPEGARRMDEKERAVQRYVIAALETRGRGCGDEFDALCSLLPPRESVAVVMLVGRYVTHALLVNTVELAPPVPSIFEDGFTGDGAPPKDRR
jgi:alkylhydroperoxidase family enzyme